MNTQKNINFENARNVLNELTNYINNKKQQNNVNNEMQLAEQNVIPTDKIEEKPLSAIDTINPLSSTEVVEQQIIESPKVESNPVLTPEISNPMPDALAPAETVIANNPLENNEITTIDSQSIQPIASPEEPIIQTPQNDPAIISVQTQQGETQGTEALPQNLEANPMNNNDTQNLIEPTVSHQNNEMQAAPIAPQLETNSLNDGIAETKQDAAIPNSVTESAPNLDGLEVVPQIDINSIMGENLNQEAMNINENEPETYKAATNMGAVAINDNPSIASSGEVMIPTGQESVPQATSPVVTEASFNESQETVKLAA